MSGGNLNGSLTIRGNGNLSFQKVSNGMSCMDKNHSKTADYGTDIKDLDVNGNYVKFTVGANNQKPVMISINGGASSYTNGTYELFGEHNINTLASSLGGRAELVSYVGTGTYGKSNPCSVTFSFAPKLIMMIGYTFNNHPSSSLPDGLFNAVTTSYTNHIACEYLTTNYKQSLGLIQDTAEESSYGKKSSNGKTIYWYTTGSWQYNDAGFKYYVLGVA